MMNRVIPTIQLDRVKDLRQGTEYNQTFIPLGVYSKVGACLLNRVLFWVVAQAEPKAYYRRSRYVQAGTYDPSDKAGGGLLVKMDPAMVMDPLGSYGLKIGAKYRLLRGAKAASNDAEREKTVKQKLGWKLKDFWRATATRLGLPETQLRLKVYEDALAPGWDQREDGVEGAHLVGVVDFTEYRALYEMLQGRFEGRTAEKSMKKYGQAAIDKMIGKPVQDQMVLTAVETIENQIREVKQKIAEERARLQKESEEEQRRIKSLYSTKIDEAVAAANRQIEALQQQSQEMTAMGIRMAC